MLRLKVVATRGSRVSVALLRGLLTAAARRPWQVIAQLATQRPLLLLLLLRLIEELAKRWAAHRQLVLGRLRVQCATEEVDGDIIQGCLISAEHLLNLGRVEKRTLFSRPLQEVLGGNPYLVKELLKAAQICRRNSNNCMVCRWLPPDERYHVLQATLNEVSAIFGQNFVHFNAMDGEKSGLFKSTWYCLTVTTPTRPESRKHGSSSSTDRGGDDSTCTFTDMSRTPRATLRVTLVNESDLRRIADDKLRPPNWGFFNSRHAERYRMLLDIARNFQLQLVRTPTDNHGTSSRSPFTNEKVASSQKHCDKPDGGQMKRVHSQPNLAQSQQLVQSQQYTGGMQSMRSETSSTRSSGSASSGKDKDKDKDKVVKRSGSKWLPRNSSFHLGNFDDLLGSKRADPDEDNCFLRVHVPHYVGKDTATSGDGPSSSHAPSSGQGPVKETLSTSAGRSLGHQRTASTPALSSIIGAAETGSLGRPMGSLERAATTGTPGRR